jgi:hypothetical protein
MQINAVAEWQAQHMVAFEVRLLIRPVDHAAAAIGGKPVKQSIKPGHLCLLETDRAIIREVVAHKMSHNS